MDEAIEVVSEVVGPKWTSLYQRLGMDYRGRFQIQSKWKQKEPSNSKACYRKCALEMLQNWRRSVQGGDEMETLDQLLNAVNGIRGFQRTANDLALRNGIQLRAVNFVGSETSSDEMLSSVETTSSFKGMSKRIPILLEDTAHKFAILDISQRLNYDKFIKFSQSLGLTQNVIERARSTNDLHEEQFYLILKTWIQEKGNSATFNQLINSIILCKEDHLIQYLTERLNL